MALLNANNLILLGEILDEPPLAEEGYRRLDAIAGHAWRHGFAEFDSPTYTAASIFVLQQLSAWPRRAEARQVAAALLELAWLKVAANWHPESGRIAGAYSRTYDYLHGHGELEAALWAAGWVDERPDQNVPYAMYALVAGGDLPPSQEAILARHGIDPAALPRELQQRWGPSPRQTRTTWIGRRVALGSSGAEYSTTDVPLAFDLADSRHVRGHITFDGRGDLFGQVPFARAGHVKAEHLQPFWTGVQRGPDALGLAVYEMRAAAGRDPLTTSFVLPSTVERAWVAGREYQIGEPALPPVTPLPRGTPIVLRDGDTAVGIRFLLTINQQGRPAPLALHRDDRLGAVALAADHRADERYTKAAAVVWVRVAEGLDDERFDHWRREFEQARPALQISRQRIAVSLEGQSGPLRLETEAPFDLRSATARTPVPTRAVLAIDGREAARRVLLQADWFQRLAARAEPPLLEVDREPFAFSTAGAGLTPPMEARHISDERLPGGQTTAIGVPIELERAADVAASARWRLQVREAGQYRLWARALVPGGHANSFYFKLSPRGVPAGDPPRAEIWGVWQLPTSPRFAWSRVRLEAQRPAGLFALQPGEYALELFAREPGVWVDALMLTRDKTFRPE